MTLVGNLYFALCAAACLAGALVTVFSRNPIRSVLGLLLTVVSIAGLYLSLHAQFLAAIQLMVYAGAVVVLFLFVIILLGSDATDPGGPSKVPVVRFVGGGLMAFLFVAAGGLFSSSFLYNATAFRPAPAELGTVAGVGTQLFQRAIIPFELATALLIVAVVGAIAVARHRRTTPVVTEDDNETRRLFKGPVHPRDAGHSLAKESAR